MIPETALTKERSTIITLVWKKENPGEAAIAEKAFQEYVRKGWLAFILGPDNKKRQVFTFDPKFEWVQLVRLVQGG